MLFSIEWATAPLHNLCLSQSVLGNICPQVEGLEGIINFIMLCHIKYLDCFNIIVFIYSIISVIFSSGRLPCKNTLRNVQAWLDWPCYISDRQQGGRQDRRQF